MNGVLAASIALFAGFLLIPQPSIIANITFFCLPFTNIILLLRTLA
jgi:hypothetical protein